MLTNKPKYESRNMQNLFTTSFTKNKKISGMMHLSALKSKLKLICHLYWNSISLFNILFEKSPKKVLENCFHCILRGSKNKIFSRITSTMKTQLKIRNNYGCNKKWASFLRKNILLEFTPICQQKSSHSTFEVLVWQIPKSCLRHSRNSYSMFTLDGILFCNLYDHKNLYSHYETNFASCGLWAIH